MTPKTETHRTRLTAGGNLKDYPEEVITPTSDLTTITLHVNITISDVTSRYICMDVKDFFWNNQMDRDEHIMIHISMIPQRFVENNNLAEKAHNVYIYERVTKGMYGLPQAGRIAHDALAKHLKPYGYHPSSKPPRLWKHNVRPINFILVVDDFGIKYLGKEHALHLKSTLETKYKLTTEWEGKLYIRVALEWDYEKVTVQISMP